MGVWNKLIINLASFVIMLGLFWNNIYLVFVGASVLLFLADLASVIKGAIPSKSVNPVTETVRDFSPSWT